MNQKVHAVLAVILLGTAQAGFAEISAGIGAGTAYANGAFEPTGSAELDCSFRTLLGAANFLRFAASGALWATPNEAVSRAEGQAALLFTHAAGLNIFGLRLEAGGETDRSDSTNAVALGLALPLTFNGETVSFSLEPKGEWNPLGDGYHDAAIKAYLSMSAGEFVFKPAASVSYTRFADATEILSASPGLDVFWYPGFPLSAGVGAEYVWESDTAGSYTAALSSVKLFAAASPANWIMLAADTAFGFADGVISNASSAEISFYPFPAGQGTISIPLKLRFASGISKSYSVMAGVRYEF